MCDEQAQQNEEEEGKSRMMELVPVSSLIDPCGNFDMGFYV